MTKAKAEAMLAARLTAAPWRREGRRHPENLISLYVQGGSSQISHVRCDTVSMGWKPGWICVEDDAGLTDAARHL